MKSIRTTILLHKEIGQTWGPFFLKVKSFIINPMKKKLNQNDV